MIRSLSLIAAGLSVFFAVEASAADKVFPSSQTAVAISSSVSDFGLLPSSSPLTVESIIANLSRVESTIKTLSAHFNQTILIRDAGITQNVAGSLKYERGSLFHIEQKLPEKQTVVSDGNSIWIWRPSRKEAIEMDIAYWAKTQPFARGLLDFGHYASMLKNYKIKIIHNSLAPKAQSGYRNIELLLTPKAASEKFSLRLFFNTRDFFPVESDFYQKGVVVRSHFSDIVYNITFSSAEFHFKMPPGTQVFDERDRKAN